MRGSGLAQRRFVKRVLRSRLLVVVLLIVVFVLGRAVWNVYQKERETSRALVEVQEREQELQEQQIFLEGEIERLQTPQGVDEEVRTRFGLARPDERVIVLVDDETSDTSSEGGVTLWERVKDWFLRN